MADVLALDRLDDEERILKEILTGWPGLVVDALEERLNIVGPVDPVVPGATDTELDAIWADNSLEADYSPAHLEALIHGVAFLTASRGGPGDPDPTITVESPCTMSGIWDPVRRRLSAAAAGSGWCQVLERGACWWCLMLASRDDVESGDFTRATGIPSTSIEERDDKRLGRSRVPDGFTPVLDPAVPTTGVPIVSADDIDVATCSRTITRTRANGTTVTRYRGGHVHGTGFPGKTEFPGWTEDDITLAFQLAMACPQWTSLAGDRCHYRRDVIEIGRASCRERV